MLQEPGHAKRGRLEESAHVPGRSAASVHTDRGAVAGADEVLHRLPGSHVVRQSRRSDGHSRVSVPVPSPALELQHGRRQLGVRTCCRYRYVLVLVHVMLRC